MNRPTPRRASVAIVLLAAAAMLGVGATCDGRILKQTVELTPTSERGEDGPSGLVREEPLEIVSDDGSLTVRIPSGALSSTIRPDELRVTRVAPESRPTTSNDVPLLATYTLEPDGTAFAIPVHVSVSLPYQGGAAPLLLLRGNDKVEVLDPLEVRLNLASGRIEIESEISHFSAIHVSLLGFFQVELFDLPDQYVNLPFIVRATVSNTKQVDFRHIWDIGLGTMIVRVEGPWTLKGRFLGKSPLSPFEVNNAPPGNLIAAGAGFTAPGSFTCLNTGRTAVIYFGEISFNRYSEVGLGGISSSSTDSSRATLFVEGRPFECLAAPTPTPSPSATPTATIPPTETAKPTPAAISTSTPTPLQWFAELFAKGPACTPDPEGDNDMLSDPSWKARPVGWTDIKCSLGWLASGANVASWFATGGPFECGATGFAEESFRIICSEYLQPMENGPVLISRIDLAAPPPTGADSTATFTYALVADSDRDPNNNFRYQGSFKLDLFQGTDRWYTLGNEPESGRIVLSSIDARGGNYLELDTAARAMIHGSSVIFVVPLKEFVAPPNELGIRQTAFSFETGRPIEGSGSMDTAGADGPKFVDMPLLIPRLGPDIFSAPGPKIR